MLSYNECLFHYFVERIFPGLQTCFFACLGLGWGERGGGGGVGEEGSSRYCKIKDEIIHLLFVVTLLLLC